jgi:hypothetical protein
MTSFSINEGEGIQAGYSMTARVLCSLLQDGTSLTPGQGNNPNKAQLMQPFIQHLRQHDALISHVLVMQQHQSSINISRSGADE